MPQLGGQVGPPMTYQPPNLGGMVFPVVGYSGPISPHHGSAMGGSDIMAPRGTPVVAMESGRVISAGFEPIGGNNVLVQGVDGNQYYYAHLDAAPAVKPGQDISAGQYLGPVGDTGNARGTGTHLHIGIGPSIVTGVGPMGGTGGSFNAIDLLRGVESGQMNDLVMRGPAPKPQPIPNATPFDPSQIQPVDYGNQYANMAAQVAVQHGLDPNIFVKQVQLESGFNPNAVSPAGAQGLTQLMPGTARGLGVSNPFDPQQALEGGARFMQQLLQKYKGDYTKALAAYNAGPGNVDKYGGIPPFAETQRYVKQILSDATPQSFAAPTSTTGPIQSTTGNLLNSAPSGVFGGQKPQHMGLFGEGDALLPFILQALAPRNIPPPSLY